MLVVVNWVAGARQAWALFDDLFGAWQVQSGFGLVIALMKIFGLDIVVVKNSA